MKASDRRELRDAIDQARRERLAAPPSPRGRARRPRMPEMRRPERPVRPPLRRLQRQPAPLPRPAVAVRPASQPMSARMGTARLVTYSHGGSGRHDLYADRGEILGEGSQDSQLLALARIRRSGWLWEASRCAWRRCSLRSSLRIRATRGANSGRLHNRPCESKRLSQPPLRQPGASRSGHYGRKRTTRPPSRPPGMGVWAMRGRP